MASETLCIRLDAGLKKQLRGYADRHNTTMSEVVETAIDEYLDPAAYRNISLKYLERLDRKYSTALKRMDLVLEMVATFVRIWFRRHPQAEDPATKAALLEQGEASYGKFFDLIVRALEDNQTVLRAFDERLFSTEDFRE